MYTIGMDVGGTKIKFGLFNQDHQIVRVTEIKTPKENIKEVIIHSLRQLINGENICGVGMASAGVIDFQNKKIKRAANLPEYVDHPLALELEKVFRVPVFIENDANCAALAEGNVGAGMKVSNFACITIGTGIGGGIIYNNHIVRGKNGYAGEVGHIVIDAKGERCKCGRRGCWEQYASGKAIERMIKLDTFLRSRNYQPSDIFKRSGSCKRCKSIVDTFIYYLSTGIVNLQYVLDPEMIIMGGGVVDSEEYWWTKLLEKTTELSNVPINLQQAVLKNNASMIGASFLVTQEGEG